MLRGRLSCRCSSTILPKGIDIAPAFRHPVDYIAASLLAKMLQSPLACFGLVRCQRLDRADLAKRIKRLLDVINSLIDYVNELRICMLQPEKTRRKCVRQTSFLIPDDIHSTEKSRRSPVLNSPFLSALEEIHGP